MFWILVGLFLWLRDPVWRVLYEGDLVSPIQRGSAAGWTELDKELVKRLTSVEIEAVAGETSLEEAIVAAVNRRRATQAAESLTAAPAAASAAVGGVSPVEEPEAPSPIEVSEELRDIARTRARTRLDLSQPAEVKAPELLFPETYLGLAARGRLIHSVEIYQKLPASASPTWPGLADELVGGWLNRTRFQSAVMEGEHLRIGVGAVASEEGDILIDVLLEETFVLLDVELTPVAAHGVPLVLSGRKPGVEEELILYFKGPSDPGFYPLEVEWQGQGFSRELEWDQGKGNYALRAGRGDRLSDPRPILVD